MYTVQPYLGIFYGCQMSITFCPTSLCGLTVVTKNGENYKKWLKNLKKTHLRFYKQTHSTYNYTEQRPFVLALEYTALTLRSLTSLN